MDERIGSAGWVVPAIRELAHAVDALAEDPESPDARRRARDSAREAARLVATGEADPRVALVVEGIRLAASDVERIAAPEVDGLEPTAPVATASKSVFGKVYSAFARHLSISRISPPQ